MACEKNSFADHSENANELCEEHGPSTVGDMARRVGLVSDHHLLQSMCEALRKAEALYSSLLMQHPTWTHIF